ncbi:MAG: gliding motility-associated C-terminal domain-containing protein [Bacteroidetes bacterium]|nr:gliding motility-associated C-terminal domain-containing protein [Bacteroidota bacterium]
MEQGKDMGDLFREAFKDFERKPSPKVWNNIENTIKTPLYRKFNFSKPMNLIIGSAIIVSIMEILYLVQPNKQQVNTQLQIKNTEVAENKKQNIITNEENTVVSSPKIINKSQKAANINTNNDLKINIPKENTTKRQNIKDLIAQADNDQIIYENQKKQNSANTAALAKTNTAIINKSNNDNQNTIKNNTVISKNNPVTEISFSPDQTICKGDKIKLSVNGGVSYLWSTGEKTQYILVNPTSSIDYSVIATDENGNRKTGLISVTVSNCNAPYIPNAFSPNSDGQSDIFKVYANDISKFEMVIVSRSGQVVYTSKNINEGWDGNMKGKQAPEGVYLYTIKYTNELNKEQIITGHVTLIR